MLRAPAARVARPLLRRRDARDVQTASWDVPIAPGGTLKVRLPTVCTLRVRAADPRSAGGWNAARVALHVEPHPGAAAISAAEARRVADGFGMCVAADYEPGKNFLLLETARESGSASLARLVHVVRGWIGGPFKAYRPQYDSNVVVDVELPGKFNLDVEVADGAVHVADTFEGDVKVITDYADIRINRLKSMYIDVESGEGDLQAVVLQGNVSVRSTQGNIDIAKVQGPSCKLNTRDGDVQARAIYADYTSVRTTTGSVRLGGAQGNTKVRTTEGSVEVAGVEGRLEIETDAGDVEAQLSVPEKVSLRSRTGDIAVSVPPSLHAKVMLEAADPVHVDPALVVDERGMPATAASGRGSSREKRSVLRGWIGESTGELRTDQPPRTIFARAPTGEVSLTPGQWAGLVVPASGAPSAPARFPRWAAAFPPPSEAPSAAVPAAPRQRVAASQ
jgi:hypothetical protein